MLLTQKQIRVLRYFRDYRKEHGISPTLEEAAADLGVSKITVYEHLKHLAAKGAVQRDKGKARSVAILYDPDPGSDTVDDPGIPILGTIAAGQPIEAMEVREEFRLSEMISTTDDHYMLRVRGKSMIDDHIDDGDLVLVERAQTARDGEIVVALVDENETTLKRLYRDDGRVRLQPANSSMEPFYPDKVSIQGIVRGVIRRFR